GPQWAGGEAGRLWLLESGTGTLGFVDEAAGRYQPIAELPGFTRGLDFCGRLAFVGLSAVRESAVFSGIPITERLAERTCGVWVVDLQTGATVAFVRFADDGVQEIFAVQVLAGVRFPELINDNAELLAGSFVLPDEALAAVPQGLFSPAPESPGAVVCSGTCFPPPRTRPFPGGLSVQDCWAVGAAPAVVNLPAGGAARACMSKCWKTVACRR